MAPSPHPTEEYCGGIFENVWWLYMVFYFILFYVCSSWNRVKLCVQQSIPVSTFFDLLIWSELQLLSSCQYHFAQFLGIGLDVFYRGSTAGCHFYIFLWRVAYHEQAKQMDTKWGESEHYNWHNVCTRSPLPGMCIYKFRVITQYISLKTAYVSVGTL